MYMYLEEAVNSSQRSVYPTAGYALAVKGAVPGLVNPVNIHLTVGLL